MTNLLDLAHDLEIMAHNISTGPWKYDTSDKLGQNWLIAFMGRDDANEHLITTDDVSTSQARSEPEADAKFIALCRNNIGEIIEALRTAAVVGETV